MPFECINITDLSHTCTELLTYCNNNYAIEINWCHCITDNYDKCDESFHLREFIIFLSIGLILIIIMFIYEYKCKENKYRFPNYNTFDIDNNYFRNTRPIKNNVQSDKITNDCNTDSNTDSNNILPKYENPPEYN